MAGSSFTRHLTEAPRRCRELKTAPVKKDRQIYVPPGWPPKVRNPGESFWEESATEYLLDCCPPDYRQHSVLRKYPLALAYLTGEHVQAQLAANFQAKSKIRHSLSKRLDPVAVEAVSFAVPTAPRAVPAAPPADVASRPSLAAPRLAPAAPPVDDDEPETPAPPARPGLRLVRDDD